MKHRTWLSAAAVAAAVAATTAPAMAAPVSAMDATERHQTTGRHADRDHDGDSPSSTAPAAPAKTVAPPRISDITMDCVGDLLRGEVQTYGPPGGTYTLTLAVRNVKGGRFSDVSTLTAKTSRARHAYPYVFTVASFQDTYQLRVTGVGSTRHSTTIRTDTCAPGTEVAEAASAVALPAGLLATGGGVAFVAYRRRRTAAAVATPASDPADTAVL